MIRAVIIATVLIAGSGIALAASTGQFVDQGHGQRSAPKGASTHAASDFSLDRAKRMVLTPAEVRTAAADRLMPADTRSLIAIPGRLRHGEYRWEDTGIPAGRVQIWVDLRRQMVSAYRNGHEIGTAVIVYGAPDMDTPIGTFPVRWKSRDYHSRSYDAPMPYAMFLTGDGVALHGSPMSAHRATHGCVGLPVQFAAKLFAVAKVGTKVTIVRSNTAAKAALPPPVSLPDA